MKTKLLFAITILFLALQSCDNEGNTLYVKVAKPKYMALEDFRASVKVLSPKSISTSGKIYAYKDIILINDTDRGIHVIDNKDSLHPKKVAFIEIPANKDMEVKGDYLYADSLMDLVVFDISNISSITEVSRLKDVFPAYIVTTFEDDVFFDYSDDQYNTGDILVGWDIVLEPKTQVEIEALQQQFFRDDILMADSAAENSATQGQGGSMARFRIVGGYLYAVDSHAIHIFNIDNLEAPDYVGHVYAGFDIETIFNSGQYLFLGSKSGMFIYSIEDAVSPQLVSEYWHGTACDPVVVDGNYAFITLRAGNTCGAVESSLEIVDISNIQNPELLKTYPMDGPYGLGISNNLLFICDGSAGLKVYDKSDVENLKLLNNFKDIITYDVIPLEGHLLMVGDNILYQYKYGGNGIEEISKFPLS